ncbi:MAG TPA: argininosuccinate lyase [Chthoniobacteraceae bacterium]|nr:argininosuccinate lyase [Chthoniobacteraceae bacterium]
MWKGRFKTDTAHLLKKYSESISFDWRLYSHDIDGSIAHSAALLDAGIITAKERKAIVAGLEEIRVEIEAGKFRFDPGLEDIHMNIESALTRRIGDAGAKLHTARSRNDQVALDLRLYLRAETKEIQKRIADLQRALVALGEANKHVIIPGYTHLQRAQPVLFAHHLLAYVEMLQRDSGRLADAAKRMNVMPLGSGAIAGSTIMLNRELVAKLLHFDGVTPNSMDAVGDRDFACELLAAIAIAGMHLSRLSEDLILWASSEFKFITISDAYTTGSSLMPQKKNPDVAELTRGKTGRLYGNFLSLLTTLKGLPMTYNRDMQEDKEPVFDSVDTIKAALEVCAGMMGEITVNEARAAEAVADWNLLATDLADYLVKKGVPFRKAHEIIGKAVALCIERGTGFAELPLADFRKLSPAFQKDVFDVLDVRKSIDARKAAGAPSTANVVAQLKKWRKLLK